MSASAAAFGRDRAFERLYNRYVGDVYRYALVVLRNPADAEDATQTTFMNAYRAYSEGELPRKPQNWLITIAHNVCRQRFRQSARRPQEVELDDGIRHGPESEGADETSAQELRQALGHLTFNQRSALVMRELEGRSYEEIADVLALSTSAVETLLFRARRALREQLEGELSCTEAELALSKQLDGRLPRAERGPLRAHLRECQSCAALARSQRARRKSLRGIGFLPLPPALGSFLGGGGAGAGAAAGAGAGAAGTGLAAKAAIALVAGSAALGGGGVVARSLSDPSPSRGSSSSALLRTGSLPWEARGASGRGARVTPAAAAALPVVKKAKNAKKAVKAVQAKKAKKAKKPKPTHPVTPAALRPRHPQPQRPAGPTGNSGRSHTEPKERGKGPPGAGTD